MPDAPKTTVIEETHGDLRLSVSLTGGFAHVRILDMDDGDVIVVREDSLDAVIAFLQRAKRLLT